jgi:ABC-type transport system substrate-binding protein
MTTDRTNNTFAASRRAFLMSTGGALAGMAAFGLVGPATAAKRHPQRGGVLQYGPSNDVGGLDAHTHNQNHVVMTTTVMYTGLTDLDHEGNIVPGIAESW